MRNRINMKRYFQVLGVSLATMLVAVLVCLGFNFFDTGNMTEEGLTAEEIATVETAGGKINVLAMGVDKDGLRTDAIMLVSYDTEANTVKALSIPRDTRMYIGSKYQKINAAHAVGSASGKPLGAQGTVEAVTRLTNIPINYYIDFTFDGVAKCMDALGPVEFEIPDLNDDGVGMVYDDPVQDLHINLKPGLQELNGEQVVHLLRYRKGNKINGVRRTYANGDIDRIAVQQDFIKALVDQKLNASLILKLPSIFKQLSKELNTNLTVKDVLKYSKYLNDLSSTNVSIFSLPGNFSGGEYEASYWICDLKATRELIETEFGYDASNITVDKSPSAKEKSSSKTNKTETTTKTTKSKTTESSQKKDTDDEETENESKTTKKSSSTSKVSTSNSKKETTEDDKKVTSDTKKAEEKKEKEEETESDNKKTEHKTTEKETTTLSKSEDTTVTQKKEDTAEKKTDKKVETKTEASKEESTVPQKTE